MLSADPAFSAALLTIEQTAPTVAAVRNHMGRYHNPAPPPKPPRGAKVAVPMLKVYTPSKPTPVSRPVVHGYARIEVAAAADGKPIVTKAVKVRPIIVKRERSPRTPDPTEEMIQDACREIRAGWTFEEQVDRQAYLNTDLRRVVIWWREISGRELLPRWKQI